MLFSQIVKNKPVNCDITRRTTENIPMPKNTSGNFLDTFTFKDINVNKYILEYVLITYQQKYKRKFNITIKKRALTFE